MFGLRTKKQLTTQFFPFHLMFGREARYPCQVPEDFQIHQSMEDDFLSEQVAIDIQRHERIMRPVEENTKRQRNRIRRKTTKKGLDLTVGALVWRRNIRSQQRKGGKLDPEFLGPFTVSKVEGKSVDLIDHNINIDNLKLCVEEVPRVPKRLKRAQPPAGTSTPLPSEGPMGEEEGEEDEASLTSPAANKVGGKALFLDSFEMTKVWEGKRSRLRCDPTQLDLVMGAVHEPGH
ncbi:uncharacterized protein LOC134072498 [Sardina pilchardus]|uniref:uncharacterized protein LOC134072498 n=1 Tax=Sardina pilchardus TaxID=27697 RepID=UPI002E165979